MTDDASEGSKSNVTEAKYAVSMNRKSEKFQTMPIFGHYVMCELRLNGQGIHFFFISGIRHWECVAPNVDIRLQSGWFWATSIPSFRERLLDFRSISGIHWQGLIFERQLVRTVSLSVTIVHCVKICEMMMVTFRWGPSSRHYTQARVSWNICDFWSHPVACRWNESRSKLNRLGWVEQGLTYHSAHLRQLSLNHLSKYFYANPSQLWKKSERSTRTNANKGII